nr:vitamin B12 dependent-methionine synthase activation domain-containing protein [Arachidicoccus ginsenosidivorans]
MSTDDLIHEKYNGIRPAPGYPACPDHTEKIKLFDLLEATQHIDIQLTESLAMHPASSVCGWYFSHPKSQYLGLAKLCPISMRIISKDRGGARSMQKNGCARLWNSGQIIMQPIQSICPFCVFELTLW